MTTEASLARQGLPLHGRIGTFEDAEDPVFAAQGSLNAGGAEDKEMLKLAEMQKADGRVHVGGRKKDARNRVARVRGGKFRGGGELGAKVRGSANEEPEAGSGTEGDLALGARLGVQGTSP